jgi:competence ComEA-like helix-hairpin-helix protein
MKGSSFRSNGIAKSFLSFSRSQRRALVLFICIGVSVLLLSKFMLVNQKANKDEPFVAVAIESAILIKEKSAIPNRVTINPLKNNYPSYTHSTPKYTKAHTQTSFTTGNLVTFDPNSATLEQLIALGLREKAAQNIINYREKGGRFRKPEDLKRIYSLTSEEVERLIPYASINPAQQIMQGDETQIPLNSSTTEAITATARPFAKPSLKIDINEADSLTWTMLPGIGAKRASAIVKFREKLGGFAGVDQVGETFGLPDSVFQNIKTNLVWNASTMRQLSLNDCTEAQLKSHPYIPWQLAKLIVAYRNQHGPFKQVDDLLKIHVIQKDWLEKVRPYLKASANEGFVVSR